MENLFSQWHKPVRARHAHVSQSLAEMMEGAPKAAITLANYLFRICIAGKPEEIELYSLPIGQNRTTEKYGGKPYAKNTLQKALNFLEGLRIVTVLKRYGKGVFKLTVHHPGGERPFEQPASNLRNTETSEVSTPQVEKLEGSNPDSAVPVFRDNHRISNTIPIEVVIDEIDEDKEIKRLMAEAPFAQDSVPSVEIVEVPIEKPKIIQVDHLSEPQKLAEKVRERVVEIPGSLQLLVLNTNADIVSNAIAAYDEAKVKNRVNDPIGYFFKAIKNEWKPRQQKVTEFSRDFLAAYEKLIQAGIVQNIPVNHLSLDMHGEPKLRVWDEQSPLGYNLVHWREIYV